MVVWDQKMTMQAETMQNDFNNQWKILIGPWTLKILYIHTYIYGHEKIVKLIYLVHCNLKH